MKSRELKQRMKGLLMFLPNLVALSWRLMLDPGVPKIEKALLSAAIAYAIVPFDFIPDFLPFVGQIDDTYLIALSLLRLINRTDTSVVRKHWRGGGDIKMLIDSIAKLAPSFLPRRISRVIFSKIIPVNDVNSDASSGMRLVAPLNHPPATAGGTDRAQSSDRYSPGGTDFSGRI
ncbi:MAG: YkvA family protein [Pyrinomonadaceae bacterium]